MVLRGCVRISGDVDIEVSYMIKQVEVLKEAEILHNSPWFQ